MNSDNFILKIRELVFESAITGTISLIERPPGRNPSGKLLALSTWFHSLSESEREFLRNAIAMSAHQATFGLLAILDGMRKIENSMEAESFELYYVKGNRRVLVNPPSAEFLHELFNKSDSPY